jgi:hypothetical protein
MPNVYIPQVGTQIEITEDWSPLLDWTPRNLVLFRKLKYTGTKAIKEGISYIWDNETNTVKKNADGSVMVVDRIVNRTVMNPLYRNDNNEMVPVVVLFEKGTILSLTEYKNSYKGEINSVWLKVAHSEDPRYKERCVEISLDEFNGAPIA